MKSLMDCPARQLCNYFTRMILQNFAGQDTERLQRPQTQ